jgi:hypothetical protein
MRVQQELHGASLPLPCPQGAISSSGKASKNASVTRPTARPGRRLSAGKPSGTRRA